MTNSSSRPQCGGQSVIYLWRVRVSDPFPVRYMHSQGRKVETIFLVPQFERFDTPSISAYFAIDFLELKRHSGRQLR